MTPTKAIAAERIAELREEAAYRGRHSVAEVTDVMVDPADLLALIDSYEREERYREALYNGRSLLSAHTGPDDPIAATAIAEIDKALDRKKNQLAARGADMLAEMAREVRPAPSVDPKVAAEDPVLIWSDEHMAYWRPDAQGYTMRVAEAGVYERADAIRRTRHCGPEKKIKLRPVPTPVETEPRIGEQLAGYSIAELEAICAKATPGQWEVYAQTVRDPADAITELAEQVHATDPFVGVVFLINAGGKCPATTGCGPTSEANANFLVAAHAALPAALQRIKELEAELWRIDATLARRPALADLPNRSAKIERAINVAATADSANANAQKAWGALAKAEKALKRLREAGEAALRVAGEARSEWDESNDAKAGKLLVALAGDCPGYRPDIDDIHDAVVTPVIVALIAAEPDKAVQARTNPELMGWFVGQTLKALNGACGISAVRRLVASALTETETKEPANGR